MELRIEPFAGRRRRLLESQPDGITVVRGAGAGDDGVNPNFYYLTGLAEPRAVLLLAPRGTRIETGRLYPGPDYVHGRMVRELLFLPTRDPLGERWGESGPIHTESVDASAVGVDAVLPIEGFIERLTTGLESTGRFQLVRGHAPSLSEGGDPDATFVARLRHAFFDLQIGDATATVHEMRRLKDAEELHAIERAVGIVGEALDRVLGGVRSGLRESEVEGWITAIYREHGGRHAFDPIVASGANALKLHYTANDGPIRAGDLLLIDTGVSIDGYKADISRTIPVDGRFSDPQRAIYDAVLDAQRAALRCCEPGAMLADLHATAFASVEQAGFGAHLPHGTSHHLGLETHDVGDLRRPLAPGSVITVEPGIYIEDQATGVRIEDDVLITDDAHRILSEAIPKKAESIEQRMARR